MCTMSRKIKKILPWVIGGVIVIAGITFLAIDDARREDKGLDGFAQCLEERGAVLYGTFWCPHCNDQKKMFGKSKKHLPYVECSTPDRKGQTPICQEKGVSGYPTWEFADGDRQTRVMSLEELAEKTGCGYE